MSLDRFYLLFQEYLQGKKHMFISWNDRAEKWAKGLKDIWEEVILFRP